MMDPTTPRLSAILATRNRVGELVVALESLRHLAPLPIEVIVMDDASDVPITEVLLRQQLPSYPWPLQVYRHEQNQGLIETRNELAKLASAPILLTIDDDAYLIDSRSITQSLAIFDADPAVGAVGLTQLKADGTFHGKGAQPSPVDYPCYAATYLGYGNLIRRDLFLELEGYRGHFQYGQEEIEFCRRMLDRGFRVVHLPEARIVHNHSKTNRDERRRMRFICRNKCFDFLYNAPLPMAVVVIPYLLATYLRWRTGTARYYQFSDRGGFRWLITQILSETPRILKKRRALKWSTYRTWRETTRHWPPYPAQDQLPRRGDVSDEASLPNPARVTASPVPSGPGSGDPASTSRTG